ncbi:hypothetical protein BKA67DRAFT_653584 [Truncatella angustata]|uniref:DUF427 domain-containing protein n=1 Tax=Truncatella angustata TaxID=152316 RepID=A0A9P8UYD6_9PEZI|nr:uncharacterized protein BKA67DRAFT_653584 [Truncatella angustata]KAH6660405.1 hypothetical protein BKA67DRAFT_653584 [Truncatella angustata]KAH8202570.1 hypothetical protein TruAng_003281 [Truncatella angustata]
MPSGHAKAAVDGTVIADAASYEVVENNIYFPPSAIKTEYFSKTDHTTHCPWKGDASYYTIKIGDKNLENAAWYYPDTFEKANHIKGYVAFYKNKVNITTE